MQFENKKAILVAPKKIEYVDEKIEYCPEDSVVVEVAYCGICGSDIPRYFSGKVHNFPLVLGHEFSGKVVYCGERVSKFKVNDLVAGIPLVPCMDCEECKAGNYQLCSNYSFIGSRQDGALQKYIILNENNVFKLLPGTDLQSAALVEPLTVAAHAISLIKEKLKKDSKIAIFGFGIIGACLSLFLSDRGYTEVSIITGSAKRQNYAKDLGVKNFYLSSDRSLQNQSFDCIFDCTSISQALETLLPLMKPNGVISIVGTKITPIEISSTAFNWIQRRELKIIGSWMSYSKSWPGSEWEESKLILAKYPEYINKLIQKVYSLEEIDLAFQSVIDKGPKVLVTPK